MPEHQVIVDEFTHKLLGLLSRQHGTDYGKIIELLVLEEMLRQALREDAPMALVSGDVWEKIRERLQ